MISTLDEVDKVFVLIESIGGLSVSRVAQW